MNSRYCPFETLYLSMANAGTSTVWASNSLSQPKVRAVRSTGPTSQGPRGFRPSQAAATARESGRRTARGAHLLLQRQAVQHVGQRLAMHQAMLDGDVQKLRVRRSRARRSGRGGAGCNREFRRATASLRGDRKGAPFPPDRCRRRRGGRTPDETTACRHGLAQQISFEGFQMAQVKHDAVAVRMGRS